MHFSPSLAFLSGSCAILFSSTNAIAVPFNSSSTISSLAPSNSTTAPTLASSTSSTAIPSSVPANWISSLPLNTTTLTPPTATQSGWYTFKNATSKAAGSTPAPVNLAPAAPPGLDPHDPIILQPNTSVNLFYQGSAPPGNASDIPVASVAIPNMAYPAVVLDHSALVTHVECDPTNLRIKFLHRNALNTAKSAWTMPKFVMTSFYEGCGQASSTGERDYLLVHALDFKPDALQVDAKIKHIGVKEAIGDENPITLDMGTYTPTSADGNVGFDSGNAPPVPNNGTAQNTTGSAADFDVALDNSIGYTSLNATSHVKRFLGLEPHAQLQGRGFFSKIWKAVKKVVQKFIPSWTLTPLNKNININLGGGNIMTPWNKKGYQLYSTGSGTNYVRLYCVDCGVKGMINVKATVTFNLIGIISAGSFSANGNMAAGLGLGVDAHYATSIPGFSKTLVVIPLSPFAIPGLITIGPHLDLGVGANAHFSASGKLYAGVGLSWPAIHAQLNLLSAPSASGFSPTVTHNFEAEGKISLGADVYVLVTIGFGVSILNGLKSFGVSLVEKPDLYLTGATGQTGCSGVQLKVGFKNEVYADIFGSHKALSTWNGPSTSKCLSIKKRDVLELPGLSEEEMRKRADSATSGPTVHLQTPEHGIGIHYADNGNMYALPATGENGTVIDMSTVLFAAKDDIVTGDANARVFHGYTDTLSSIGISRFRLSKSSHIPSTAVPVTLQGVAFENQNVLVAVDAGRNQLYPMLCVFGDTDFPKLFLAKDPHAGIDALKSDTNVATITGVKPEDCDFIPLISV